MKKRLSTSLTFFWKYVFSTVWLGVFTIGTIASIHACGIEGMFFFIALIFSFAIYYYSYYRAKSVHIDNEYLYVSNFKKNIKIPLKNIKHVSDNFMLNPRPIFIEFRNETEFGKRIMFIGYTVIILPSVK